MKPKSTFDFALMYWFDRQPKGHDNDMRGALAAMAKKIGKSKNTLNLMRQGRSMTINSDAVQKVIAELGCDPAIVPVSIKKQGRHKKPLDFVNVVADTTNGQGGIEQ